LISYTLKGVGAGVVLIPHKGDILKFAIELDFPAMHNVIEYEGLVTNPHLTKGLGIR
jgi:hypothetical protein